MSSCQLNCDSAAFSVLLAIMDKKSDSKLRNEIHYLTREFVYACCCVSYLHFFRTY